MSATNFTLPPAAPFEAAAPLDIKAEIAAGMALIPTLPAVLDFALIGSAMYLQHANDVDFAVLIDPAHNAVDYAVRMQDDGWGQCGEYDGVGGIWAAVRRENLNLMVSHDPKFFADYKRAMEVCKALRLRHKEDRVAVCQIVRDNKTADEVFSHARIYGSDRLSDAAPDMLESLKRIASLECDWSTAPWHKIAREAVAKATGAASC